MEKINIAEILKSCQKGMELDCTMFVNPVTLNKVVDDDEFPITIETAKGDFVTLTEYGTYAETEGAKCVIFPKGKTTWEGFVPPCKFKDGDIVFSGVSLISIFKGIKKGYCGSLHSYVSVGKNVGFNIDKDCWTLENIRLATEEEKEKLFQAIKDNGYKWNEEAKSLEKLTEPKFKVGDKVRHKSYTREGNTVTEIKDNHYILDDELALPFICQDDYELVPNKFDITTLKPFDKVLVRDNNSQEWRISFFSHYNKLLVIKYSCINGYGYMQCIPYEGNEHLLATNKDCDEHFNTWE